MTQILTIIVLYTSNSQPSPNTQREIQRKSLEIQIMFQQFFMEQRILASTMPRVFHSPRPTRQCSEKQGISTVTTET